MGRFIAAMPLMLIVTFMPLGFGQESKLAIVDFERAVVQSKEGTKGQEKFNAKTEEWNKKVEAKQKEMEDAQTRLRTQDRVLSEVARADLNRTITRVQTELTRMGEDAQLELDALRMELLRPTLELAQQVLNAYAADKGYNVVIDVSVPDGNVLFYNKANDITADLIKAIDAATPAAATPAPATPAATAPAPRP
nr:TraF: type-F conjugative transfer system pilin assembly protein [uncultured bacterium]